MSTELQAYQAEPPKFNPNQHIMQIKSGKGNSDYLPVQWRLVWFREHCPQGTIETEEIVVDLDRECEAEVSVWNQDTRRSEKTLKRAPGYARFRATVTDGKGGRATATKTERGVDFGDFVEKAETGAVGRALAMLGFGTQFIGDDFNEEHRIVDAPVEKPEQDKHAYQQRRPFVEGTVAVKEAQPKPAPGTEHLTNGDGSPAFPAQMPQAPTMTEIWDVFVKLYKPERWETFKQMVFGQKKANEQLTDDDHVQLWDKLSSIKKAAPTSGK